MTLVTRHHAADGRVSEAVYSSCEQYRYALTRTWDTTGRRLLYVMLNPSKATELANDPTIERCERRARQLGYGSFRVSNLFALRETDPARLKRAIHREGPDNAAQLAKAAQWADDILCAWGVHGSHKDQGESAECLLRDSGKTLMTLGLTKDGLPRHPLYVSYKTKPSHWVLSQQ